MYTVVETAKIAGVDVVEYLTDVLSRLGTHPANRIDELTPTGWREQRRHAGTD